MRKKNPTETRRTLRLAEYLDAIRFQTNCFVSTSSGASRAHHKISFFSAKPRRNHRPLHARTQLRTHARTQCNRNGNRNRFPGWHHPPTSMGAMDMSTLPFPWLPFKEPRRILGPGGARKSYFGLFWLPLAPLGPLAWPWVPFKGNPGLDSL